MATALAEEYSATRATPINPLGSHVHIYRSEHYAGYDRSLSIVFRDAFRRREMAAHVARLNGPRLGPRLLAKATQRFGQAIRSGVERGQLRPPTDYGERILARERDVAGHPVVATTHAMYHYPAAYTAPGRHFHGKVQPHTGEQQIVTPWYRLGWEEISKVSWDSLRNVLTVAGLPGRRTIAALGPDAALDLYLSRRTRLVDLARDRVAATLVVSRRIPVAAGGTVLITGRRRPGSNVVTWVVFSGVNGNGGGHVGSHHLPEEDGADPYLVRAQVQQAIRSLRAELHL
jgi:hypothetical protein